MLLAAGNPQTVSSRPLSFRTDCSSQLTISKVAGIVFSDRRPGADGRSVALVLTPRGRRLAQRTRAARRDALAEVLDVLEPRERTQLTAIAEKLVGAVVTQRLEARAAGEDPPGGWLCRLCDPNACERADGHCPALETAISSG
jgi:hypothetical protein